MEFYKAGTSLDEGDIVINCKDLNQAKKLDNFLWENISDIFLPHKICNDPDSPDAPILISFPGIKYRCDKSTYLINLNPKLPPNFQDFKSSYQLVIEDGGEYQKIARESFKVCLEYGIKPNYIG